MSRFHLQWPWNHVEAAEHKDEVVKKGETVDYIYKEARRLKLENGMGQAVARALAKQPKGHEK